MARTRGSGAGVFGCRIIFLIALILFVLPCNGLREFPHAEEHSAEQHQPVKKSKYGTVTRRDAMVLDSEERECAVEDIMAPNPLEDPSTLNSKAELGLARSIDALSNLTFCNSSFVSYTALLPKDEDIHKLDSKAKDFFNAADRVLQRFDCRDFYPYESCEPCKLAYKRWICGIMFPMKCKDQNEARRLCKDVCYEVVRKCPVELEFHCPTDDKAYGPAASVPPHPCNPVGLAVSGAARQSVSLLLVVATVVVGLLTF